MPPIFRSTLSANRNCMPPGHRGQEPVHPTSPCSNAPSDRYAGGRSPFLYIPSASERLPTAGDYGCELPPPYADGEGQLVTRSRLRNAAPAELATSERRPATTR